MNREQYLTEATRQLQRLAFEPASLQIPEDVRLTCGWTHKGGTSAKRKTVGQCWPRELSEEKVNQVFISPVVGDTLEVLGILAHELVHAIDDCQNGHKAPFRRMALAIGLTGKMTATETGTELLEKFKTIQEDLGEYPHEPLQAPPPKQKNRQLLLLCATCGAKWRMAKSWISEVTCCPCCQETDIEGV